MEVHNRYGGKDRNITDDDIAAIVIATIEALKTKCPDCQFEGISRDDLVHVIEFVKAFMNTITESKSAVLKTLITLLVGGVVGGGISLMAYGAYTKIMDWFLP